MKTTIIKYMTLAILLLMTVGFAGCGEEESVGSLQYPVLVDEQVNSFFNNISRDYNWRHRDFFHDSSKEDDMCIIINSDEELRSAYKGEGQLPPIDFNQYSLVLGKVYVDISWNLKEQKMEIEGRNALLHLYFEHPTEATIDQMTERFYWGVYKKINTNKIKTRKYYDGKEL